MTWFRSNKSSSVERSAGQKMQLPEITAGFGYDMGVITSTQSVYLLISQTGEQVVLKAENSASENAIRHDRAYKIMNMVNSTSAVALTEKETAVANSFNLPAETGYSNAVAEVKAGRRFWVKAGYVSKEANLKNVNEWRFERGNASPKEIAAMLASVSKVAKALTDNSKAWESLGKIAAADNLNGNPDRFSFTGTGSIAKHIQNWGNVMVNLDGADTDAAGLDAFAPDESAFGAAYMSWEAENGIFLKDVSKGKAVIKIIFDEMKETIFTQFGLAVRWSAKDLKAFQDGYANGVSILKKKVMSRSNRDLRKEAVLQQRIKYLKWDSIF